MASRKSAVIVGILVAILVIGGIVGLVLYLTGGGGDSPDATTTSPYYSTTSLATEAPAPRGPVRVTVEQGALEGEWRQQSSKTVAAFLGVPYAAPPIGKLRFKAPKPAASWEGVRPAKNEAAICAQPTRDGLTATGSEDCLYLNIFTPALPSSETKTKLPVYFFIHGGQFLYGSSSTDQFGHHFISQHDIVVVTIQYRVNSLGFASLDTETIPGNTAVKDGMAALQWVHRNIGQFGGDPDKITVGGQSAGSCLAGWLTVLPESAKLMRGAILQSGTAYHNWAYKEDHVPMAYELASIVAKKKVDSVQEAEKVLMEASTEELTLATGRLGVEKLKTQPELPYQPTPEKRRPIKGGEPLLITKDAESYFFNSEAPSVPQMIGVTNKEWRFYYYENNPSSDPAVDQKMFDDLSVRVPKNLIPTGDTKQLLGLSDTTDTLDDVIDQVKKAIKEQTTPSCDLSCILKEYYDDIWMATDTQRLGAWRAHHGETTYLFRFGVRTEFNRQFISPLPESESDAAIHGDDLPYIWYRTNLNQSWDGDSIASLTIRRMVTMWTNFIKHGKPTVGKSDLLPVEWVPNRATGDGVSFLDIGPEGVTMRHGLLAGRMTTFWNSIYSKYRSRKSK